MVTEMGRQPSSEGSFAAVIGGLVRSRSSTARGELHGRVAEAIERVNREVTGAQPLTQTVGDEFQGLYRSLPDAIEVTLLVRLYLVGVTDVRFGIGWGSLEVFDPEALPYQQDGPAWWAARDALDRVAGAQQQRETPKGWRTAFTGEELGPTTEFVNAFLVCRDELMDRLGERDARIMTGLMEGLTQQKLAAREGVTQSAIAQRIASSGIYALLRSHRTLKDAASWKR